MNKHRKRLRIVGIALLVVIVVMITSFKIYTSRYYRADEDIIFNIEKSYENIVHSYSDDNGMVFVPADQEYRAVIVFYPGGKVEAQAYSGLMYELASHGYVCLLPRMPENLAFLKINAVDGIKKRYPEETEMVNDLKWYLAGHSLGGVAASAYLIDNYEDYAGVILCASYTTEDFSDKDLRLLSIYGSNDGVLNMSNYENSKAYWPENSTEYIIQGGIHSYFGSYGIQSGDGDPDISNEEQIKEAADVIADWIESIY